MIMLERQERVSYKELRSRAVSLTHNANVGRREVVTSMQYLVSEVTVKVWEGEKLFYLGWPHLSPSPLL